MRHSASHTAEVMALFRAIEWARPAQARIVDDPFAQLFIGPASRIGMKSLIVSRAPWLTRYVLVRHRFMDDCLTRALNNPSSIAQVVILGAGYDTRAYRFAQALKGRPVFELDWPLTSRRKANLVRANAQVLPETNVQRVEIDFLRDQVSERPEAAGFVRGARTFFIVEGVSMYLTPQAVWHLLGTLRDLSGRTSEMVIDFWLHADASAWSWIQRRISEQFLSLIGEPIRFTFRSEYFARLIELGFRIQELADGNQLRRRYALDKYDTISSGFAVMNLVIEPPSYLEASLHATGAVSLPVFEKARSSDAPIS